MKSGSEKMESEESEAEARRGKTRSYVLKLCCELMITGERERA